MKLRRAGLSNESLNVAAQSQALLKIMLIRMEPPVQWKVFVMIESYLIRAAEVGQSKKSQKNEEKHFGTCHARQL